MSWILSDFELLGVKRVQQVDTPRKSEVFAPENGLIRYVCSVEIPPKIWTIWKPGDKNSAIISHRIHV